MRRSLCLLPLTLAATLGAQEASIRASVCGVSFRIPITWELVPAAGASEPPAGCGATLRPNDWASRLVADDSFDRYSIHVSVYERGIKETLESASFRRDGASWVVTGSAGTSDFASAVSGVGWRGAYGITGFRCLGKGAGGFAGICEMPFAAIGTPQRSAIILGGVASTDIVESLLTTFRFAP